MKYFVCVSTKYPEYQGFTSYVMDYQWPIECRDDVLKLTKAAEHEFNKLPENRKGYESFMLVSFQKLDTPTKKNDGGTVLL